jgi:hypothetical protein
MKTAGKEFCKCGQLAVWVYMPGFSSGDSPYFCENCVPRGCSCNYRSVDENSYHPPLEKPDLPDGEEGFDWKWIEPNKVWCYIDDEGREYPCCEYEYDALGFEKE